MDSIRFNTENNEYNIEICKKPRSFSLAQYGNYECHIKFYDILLNRVVLDIDANETQLMNFMNLLYNDEVLLQGIYNVVPFNNITLLILSSESPLFPCEDDPTIYFQFFEENPIYGKVSRLYLPTSLSFKDDLLFNLYKILEDIPYFNELKYIDLVDYGLNYDFLDNED